MNYRLKQQLIGLAVGLVANAVGIVLYILIFSKFGLSTTLADAYEKNYIGKLIALGGILDLIAFFFFIRRDENERARGVLMATFILAFITLLLQLK